MRIQGQQAMQAARDALDVAAAIAASVQQKRLLYEVRMLAHCMLHTLGR